MKVSELYPSKYLKADDIPGQADATIVSIGLEEVGPDKDLKTIIRFRELSKPLVANKTNCESIADIHGDETDEWPGKRITLYTCEVSFAGKQTQAIRVRKVAPKAQLQSAPQPVPEPPSAWQD